MAGVRIGTTMAGIRKAGRRDLTVVEIAEGSSVAGVFTLNRFCAAPVQLCRRHLEAGLGIRALLINTGNANAGTGDDGLVRATSTCIALAQHLEIAPEQILPFSTGVIMETLPSERIDGRTAGGTGRPAARPLGRSGDRDHDDRHAAQGGLAPGADRRRTVTVTGISKGAGMIKPNMATMLGFIATDAAVDPALLQPLLDEAAGLSFNRITIDGDTSTNDSLVLIATHQAGHPPIERLDSAEGQALRDAVVGVAQTLAQAIVRDGEGATKFITIEIVDGRDEAEVRKIAYAIAHSPLVKTAFFASDPNLGRILAAVGYAGVDDLDQGLIEMHLDDVHVVTRGGRHPAYREEDGQRVMKQAEITIRIDLRRGSRQTTVWTCDLSHDYVSINADYRS